MRITGFHNVDVFQKKILVLNADTYSGDTLKRAKDVLSWDKPKEVRTGTILCFTKDRNPSYDPDFYGEELSSSKEKKRLPWRSNKYAFEDQHDFHSLKGVLVVLHGHVATGKTSVTDAIAKHLGYTPLYSDWYWFKYGLGNRAQDHGVSHTHNKHMLGRCWSALGSGYNVVLDCTSRWRTYRDEIREAFVSTEVAVVFVYCFCPREIALQRIEKRKIIGPHDFGTVYEYERVESDFDEMSDKEIYSSNLIKVDTNALNCEIPNSRNEMLGDLMNELIQAIEVNYFAKVRNSQT